MKCAAALQNTGLASDGVLRTVVVASLQEGCGNFGKGAEEIYQDVAWNGGKDLRGKVEEARAFLTRTKKDEGSLNRGVQDDQRNRESGQSQTFSSGGSSYHERA